MMVKIFTSLSGTAYMPDGIVLDVADDVAARLIAGGTAVPVVSVPVVSAPMVSAPVVSNDVTGATTAAENTSAKQPTLELRKLTAAQVAGLARIVEYFEADPTAQSAEQLAAAAASLSE
jgi:hypothetical protein